MKKQIWLTQDQVFLLKLILEMFKGGVKEATMLQTNSQTVAQTFTGVQVAELIAILKTKESQ